MGCPSLGNDRPICKRPCCQYICSSKSDAAKHDILLHHHEREVEQKSRIPEAKRRRQPSEADGGCPSTGHTCNFLSADKKCGEV